MSFVAEIWAAVQKAGVLKTHFIALHCCWWLFKVGVRAGCPLAWEGDVDAGILSAFLLCGMTSPWSRKEIGVGRAAGSS